MSFKRNSLRVQSIYIQAVTALLIINLLHKIVREIPGAIKLDEKFGILLASFLTIILIVSIIFLLQKRKAGLFLGMLPAVWAMLQWIIVHVLKGYPDQNGVWWYPIFPISQGVLILYFLLLLLRNEEKKLLEN